jgi:radical SAM superfamily enzyme YgiQ (UPF0313 family)
MCLIGVNAKFTHTNLAVRYLTKVLRRDGFDAGFFECSINEHNRDLLAGFIGGRRGLSVFLLYLEHDEDCGAFPGFEGSQARCRIVWGGPEVSFCPEEIISKNPFVDFIVCGEGEKVVSDLLSHIGDGEFEKRNLSILPERRVKPRPFLLSSFENIPSPYENEDLSSLKDRILYFETSRGCPNNCSYCLSSVGRGVVFCAPDRVRAELLRFMENRVPVVKLVDRTFNCDKTRALAIFAFIKAHNKSTLFHLKSAPTFWTTQPSKC